MIQSSSLYLALSGKRAKALSGLKFEILYKKITESTGEYYLKLQLPKEMRHMDFGDVAISLPIVELSIFTNGNFKIDCGFPYHFDFSQSFGIGVFPFAGAGGFYFGYLDRATSTQVPEISNGRFDPVIAFGFGLNMGLGKNIQMGILTGGFDLTVDGLLQGCIGFFHPNNPLTPKDNFYKIQGTIAIVAKVYGSINFTIINASFTVMAYASARLTLQSFETTNIELHAGVSVNLTIKVVFIHVHLHFSKTISHTFTIGTPGTPPWSVNTPSRSLGNLQSNAPDATVIYPFESKELLEVFHDNEDVSTPDTALNWSAASTKWANKYYSSVKQLDLTFSPAITKKGGDAQVVALLFIENTVPQHLTNPFNVICEAIFAFALQAYYDVAAPTNLQSQKVTVADLTAILSGCETSFSLSQLQTYLQGNISLKIGTAPTTADTKIQGSFFPMLPELSLSCTGLANTIDFSKPKLDAAYLKNIAAYCNLIMGGAPVSTVSSSESIATFMFHDYFSFMMKETIEKARDLLAAYLYTPSSSDTLTTLSTTFSNSELNNNAFQIAIAKANATQQVLDSSKSLSIQQYIFATNPQKTLAEIAALISSSITASDLATYNKYIPGLVARNQNIKIASLSYTVPASQTIADIAAQFFTTSANVKPLSNRATGKTVIDTLLPLTTVAISKISFSTTATLDTLEAIAQHFSIPPMEVLSLNPLLTTAGTIAVGTHVSIPNIMYTTAPTDKESILSYFGGTLKSPPATITTGTVLTVKNASYKTRQNDTFESIANHFSLGSAAATPSVTVADIIAGNATIKLLATTIQSPVFSHKISQSDTLQGIANKYGMTVAALANNNLTIPMFAKPITIPNVSLPFSTILSTLSSKSTFTTIATTLSRFFFYGLRLPVPAQTFPADTTPTSIPQWAVLSTSGLYELTGQQFAAPDVTSPEQENASITLSSSATWVTVPAEAILFSLWQKCEIAQISSTTSSFSGVTPVNTYTKSPARFTLEHPIYWHSSQAIGYQNPTAVEQSTKGPLIWFFPQELNAALPKMISPKLVVGEHIVCQSKMQTSDVGNYAWATTLRLGLKKVNGEKNIYSLGALDPKDQKLLGSLITEDLSSVSAFFAYSGGNGITSDVSTTVDKKGIVLLKTSLATEKQVKTKKTVVLSINSSFSPSDWMGNPSGKNNWCFTMPAPKIFTDTQNVSKSAYVVGFSGAGGDWGTVAWWPNGGSITIPLDATKITFWAVGRKGGEIVHFGFGTETEYKHEYTLTKDWAKYSLMLPAGYSQSDLMNGGKLAPFYWAVGAGDNSGDITFAISAETTGINIVKVEHVQEKSATPPPYDATIADPANFLKILWQCGALEADGCYLSYATAQYPDGLPSSAFKTPIEATVYLVIPSPTPTKLHVFNNAVITKEAIDTSSRVFFIEDAGITRMLQKFPAGHVGWEFIQKKTIPEATVSFAEMLYNICKHQYDYDNFNTSASISANQTFLSETAWKITTAATTTGADNNTVSIGWHNASWNLSFSGLSTATSIVFKAVGQNGGEQIKVGVVLPGNDRKLSSVITLTNAWAEYKVSLNEIDLQPSDYSTIATPFIIYTDEDCSNDESATFYIDQTYGIEYWKFTKPTLETVTTLDVETGFQHNNGNATGGSNAPTCKMQAESYSDINSVAKAAVVMDLTANGGGGFTVGWEWFGQGTVSVVPSNSTALSFWAVGENGGEKVVFGCYSGSTEVSRSIVLTTTWTQYSISLPTEFTSFSTGKYPFLWKYDEDSDIHFAVAVGSNDLVYTKKKVVYPTVNIQNYTDQLFHLIGNQITNKTGVALNVQGLPVGPTTLPEDKITKSIKNDNHVYYHQILPTIPRLQSSSPLFSATPDSTQNPYKNIGKNFYINIDAHDIFGNKSQISATPAELPLQYYDRVIGLKSWPNTAASFLFAMGEHHPKIKVFFDFAVNKYFPDENRSFSTCIQHAKSDKNKYAQIYYQINASEAKLSVDSSITQSIATQPTKTDVLKYVEGVYAFLATIDYLSEKLNAGNIPYLRPCISLAGSELTTVDEYIGAYYLDAEQLGERNKNVAGIFDGHTVNLPQLCDAPFNNTLTSICALARKELNITLTAVELVNAMAEKAVLSSGVVLTIKSGTHYTIKPQDTFNSIVTAFHADSITLTDLATNNAAVENIFVQNSRLLLTTQTTTGTSAATLYHYKKNVREVLRMQNYLMQTWTPGLAQLI
ncbi:MAG: LysM peptidoglycan-binding domain-containing protein [Gammaproteobacteria bacterium]|nr:LysM peptidoglycan-binding domain-containing protein [Gammaproteobacteria bacterium]